MNNYEVTNTYTTKHLTVKHIIVNEWLADVIEQFKPEWATEEPMVSYGKEQTYISWNR